MMTDTPESRIGTNQIDRDMCFLGSEETSRRRRGAVYDPRDATKFIEGEDLGRVRGGGERARESAEGLSRKGDNLDGSSGLPRELTKEVR